MAISLADPGGPIELVKETAATLKTVRGRPRRAAAASSSTRWRSEVVAETQAAQEPARATSSPRARSPGRRSSTSSPRSTASSPPRPTPEEAEAYRDVAQGRRPGGGQRGQGGRLLRLPRGPRERGRAADARQARRGLAPPTEPSRMTSPAGTRTLSSGPPPRRDRRTRAGGRARRAGRAAGARARRAGLFRLCVPDGRGRPRGASRHAHRRGPGAGRRRRRRRPGASPSRATSGLLAGYLPEESRPRDLRRAGDDGRRRVRAQGPRDRRAGRLPRQRPLAVRERLPARRLADGRLRGRRRRHVRMLPNGMPDVRLVLAPAEAFTIHDTWHVDGPARHRQPRHRARRRARPGRAQRLGVQRPAGPDRPALRVPAVRAARAGDRGRLPRDRPRRARRPGRARRRQGRRPAGGARWPSAATVQAEVARAEAAVRAAGALLDEAIGEAWERAVAAGSVDVRCRARPAARRHARDRRRRCRPPRPPTGWPAAARSTSRARCSAACATSMRPRSTCSSRPRPGS